MEHSPNAAEGMLHGPTFLYSTFKTIPPCLCLSPIPGKSPPGCQVLCRAALRIKRKSNPSHPGALAVQTHTAGHSCRPAGNGSLAGKGDGGLCRHLRALQTSPLISKDDAINYPDEHLPSASEQGLWEGWASAGGAISSGAFSPNKNISFLHRLNRDPQDTFSKSQPGEESKGQLPVGTPGWQRHREVSSCFPKKIHTSTEVNCAHRAPTKQGKHLWVREAAATSGASRCDFCSYLTCHLCPCKYEANIDL